MEMALALMLGSAQRSAILGLCFALGLVTLDLSFKRAAHTLTAIDKQLYDNYDNPQPQSSVKAKASPPWGLCPVCTSHSCGLQVMAPFTQAIYCSPEATQYLTDPSPSCAINPLNTRKAACPAGSNSSHSTMATTSPGEMLEHQTNQPGISEAAGQEQPRNSLAQGRRSCHSWSTLVWQKICWLRQPRRATGRMGSRQGKSAAKKSPGRQKSGHGCLAITPLLQGPRCSTQRAARRRLTRIQPVANPLAGHVQAAIKHMPASFQQPLLCVLDTLQEWAQQIHKAGARCTLCLGHMWSSVKPVMQQAAELLDTHHAVMTPCLVLLGLAAAVSRMHQVRADLAQVLGAARSAQQLSCMSILWQRAGQDQRKVKHKQQAREWVKLQGQQREHLEHVDARLDSMVALHDKIEQDVSKCTSACTKLALQLADVQLDLVQTVDGLEATSRERTPVKRPTAQAQQSSQRERHKQNTPSAGAHHAEHQSGLQHKLEVAEWRLLHARQALNQAFDELHHAEARNADQEQHLRNLEAAHEEQQAQVAMMIGMLSQAVHEVHQQWQEGKAATDQLVTLKDLVDELPGPLGLASTWAAHDPLTPSRPIDSRQAAKKTSDSPFADLAAAGLL